MDELVKSDTLYSLCTEKTGVDGEWTEPDSRCAWRTTVHSWSLTEKSKRNRVLVKERQTETGGRGKKRRRVTDGQPAGRGLRGTVRKRCNPCLQTSRYLLRRRDVRKLEVPILRDKGHSTWSLFYSTSRERAMFCFCAFLFPSSISPTLRRQCQVHIGFHNTVSPTSSPSFSDEDQPRQGSQVQAPGLADWTRLAEESGIPGVYARSRRWESGG